MSQVWDLAKATHQHKPCDLSPGSFIFLRVSQEKHPWQDAPRNNPGKGLKCGNCVRFGGRCDRHQSMQGKDWVMSIYFWGDLRPGDHRQWGWRGSLSAGIRLVTEMQILGLKLSKDQCGSSIRTYACADLCNFYLGTRKAHWGRGRS